MPCENAAQSENYFEFIGEYSGVLDYVKEEFNTECITVIDQRFAIAYVKKNGRTSIYGQNYPYNTIPRCFGLMDTQMLEDVGVAQVRRSTLDLYGNGVLVGMIDTGIDYEHPAFRYEDGSSKIYSLWDQTIEGDSEDTFLGYGTEYTKEQIEEALKSDVPQQKVPSKDESGHGTFLAGLIAGNEDNETGFSGIAPNAGLVVVKLRKAKDYLKEYYCIDPKYEAYAETDIMLAVHYIDHIAEQLQRPIVIFLGIGTNLASHLGTGPLDQYLSGRAMLRGVAVVTSAGNEGQARHHYSGQVSQNDEKVEVKVGESEYGFAMELWGLAPNRYYVDIESPSGQKTGRIQGGLSGQRYVTFLLEKTRLIVEYFTVDTSAGAPVIVMRFQNPAPGIWNIYVSDDGVGNREFDLWLPITNFISEDTFFLESTPYNTLVAPSNTGLLISCGSYNSNTGSLAIDSSRGFPRNAVKPDFTAPGVEILGPLPRKRYGRKSGTSVSGAITAGIAALMLEWGIVQKNDMQINTTRIKNYLIRGARRDPERIYPNREWGYGQVDLYETFLGIR